MLIRTLYPEDIFYSIVNYSGMNKIPKDDILLHTTLYELKEKYPALLRKFAFDTNGTIPSSEDLDQILMLLPSHDPYNPELKIPYIKGYFRECIYPKLTDNKKILLKNAGKDFAKIVRKKLKSD